LAFEDDILLQHVKRYTMVNVTVCVSDLAGIYCAYRRMLPSLCSSEPEDWRECTRAYVPSRECYCTAYECQFKNSIV